MLVLGENIQVLPRWLLNPLLKYDNVADAVDAAVHPFCPVVSVTLGDHPFPVSLSGKSWLVKSWPGFILFLTNDQFMGGSWSSLIPGKWGDLSRKGFFSLCEISLFKIILSHCKLSFYCCWDFCFVILILAKTTGLKDQCFTDWHSIES